MFVCSGCGVLGSVVFGCHGRCCCGERSRSGGFCVGRLCFCGLRVILWQIFGPPIVKKCVCGAACLQAGSCRVLMWMTSGAAYRARVTSQAALQLLLGDWFFCSVPQKRWISRTDEGLRGGCCQPGSRAAHSLGFCCAVRHSPIDACNYHISKLRELQLRGSGRQAVQVGRGQASPLWVF
jgi:hypothetical protein